MQVAAAVVAAAAAAGTATEEPRAQRAAHDSPHRSAAEQTEDFHAARVTAADKSVGDARVTAAGDDAFADTDTSTRDLSAPASAVERAVKENAMLVAQLFPPPVKLANWQNRVVDMERVNMRRSLRTLGMAIALSDSAPAQTDALQRLAQGMRITDMRMPDGIKMTATPGSYEYSKSIMSLLDSMRAQMDVPGATHSQTLVSKLAWLVSERTRVQQIGASLATKGAGGVSLVRASAAVAAAAAAATGAKTSAAAAMLPVRRVHRARVRPDVAPPAGGEHPSSGHRARVLPVVTLSPGTSSEAGLGRGDMLSGLVSMYAIDECTVLLVDSSSDVWKARRLSYVRKRHAAPGSAPLASKTAPVPRGGATDGATDGVTDDDDDDDDTAPPDGATAARTAHGHVRQPPVRRAAREADDAIRRYWSATSLVDDAPAGDSPDTSGGEATPPARKRQRGHATAAAAAAAATTTTTTTKWTEDSDQIQWRSDRHYTRCFVCNSGGNPFNLLVCDTCPRIAHVRCDRLRRVPEGAWSCSHCRDGDAADTLTMLAWSPQDGGGSGGSAHTPATGHSGSGTEGHASDCSEPLDGGGGGGGGAPPLPVPDSAERPAVCGCGDAVVW